MSMLSFLDRSHTIAKPGFSRWMVPPAALCVHLCIGQAYAFSVFNLPMTKLLGITQSTPGDWNIPQLGWIFSIAIFFLGASSAVFGRWVEEGGPRRAMFTAALCSPPSASTSTICGPSISATGCSAASRSASATSRRSRP
jgi:MFS family permease